MMLIQIVKPDHMKWGDLGGYQNYEFGYFVSEDINYDTVNFPDNEHLGLLGFMGKGRNNYGVRKDEYNKIGEV